MSFVAEVRGALGPAGVVTDPGALESYRRDHAGLVEAGTPLAAVFPTSTQDVVAVVEAARRHRVPLVPRGAGSGLSGGANAVDGATMVVTTTDPAESELLLAARRFAFPALEQSGDTLLDDIGVPRDRVTDLIGLLKRDHLARELGEHGMRLQRLVKGAFDPEGLLNPGKVL